MDAIGRVKADNRRGVTIHAHRVVRERPSTMFGLRGIPPGVVDATDKPRYDRG